MRRAALPAALLAAVVLIGCGGDDGGGDGTSAPDSATTAPEASAAPPYGELSEPRCEAAEPNCAEARGEIAYVEGVDPDGDGDAHFVLLSGDGITAPGITVVDVAAELRPRPLPGPGDLLAAAGPVYPGSYGQEQIQATAIDFVRADGG